MCGRPCSLSLLGVLLISHCLGSPWNSIECPRWNGKLDIFYKEQNPTGRLDKFFPCHGVTGCPSQAGQTLCLEWSSSPVAVHIISKTYRVPQFLVELDILWILECPSLLWLVRFYWMPRAGMVSCTYSIRCRTLRTSGQILYLSWSSQAGQTLLLQCHSSEVGGYILLRTCRVPQPLLELNIL